MSKTHRLSRRREIRRKVIRKWRDSNYHRWRDYEDGDQHRCRLIEAGNETLEYTNVLPV